VNDLICKVALDTPLRRLFDYRYAGTVNCVRPGMRVCVPFGRQRLVGVVMATATTSDVPAAKLRDIFSVLDDEPLLGAGDLTLLEWAANYYHHPIGAVIAAALPRLLRTESEFRATQRIWAATDAGRRALLDGQLRRAPKQQQLLEWLATQGPCDDSVLEAAQPGWRAAGNALLKRELVAHATVLGDAVSPAKVVVAEAALPELTAAQRVAVDVLTQSLHQTDNTQRAFLLDGVTGSGKTEVYMRLVATTLAQGRSVLVMCPEIGLTPQLFERFEERFGGGIAALHSGLTDMARARAWHTAARGNAGIVIGTRSAVFTPIPALGLIIVDEEHDPSYKQQDGGFRYSARDLALLRGQQQKVPVVLGSATPSLESLHNVSQQRLQHLLLPERAGNARAPKLSLIDLRAHSPHKGLSSPLTQAMDRHLAAGTQVLLFINRRGYAPTLLCGGCGWIAPCHSCDARMTVHQRSGRLACHHCGAEEKLPERCPRCGHEVHPLGHGTERVEETLAERFPGIAVERFDRDVLRAQAALEDAIDRVHSGAARILVGTQMLTKGHHFPDVTLVGVLNADQSLFSTDFRAAERLAQTIVQVAGRAGRADREGEVLLQSQYPDHPLLMTLLEDGYAGFASRALSERAEARWPPFSRMAVLRASDTTPEGALKFLETALHAAQPPAGVVLRRPVPAAMMRRAGRYYAQLLIESAARPPLQRFLAEWVPAVEALPARGQLRWALDIDPLDVF
jgi:primosomal protein N' (replication factor Y) (superfamily II helicase)